MLKSVTIIGSSSGRNAGDAALLAGIMASIDRACGERLVYEIPTYRPEFIWHSYENKTRPISMLPWAGTVGMLGIPTLRSVLRSDLTIIYDAMLFDRKLYNPLTNYMPTAWMFLPLAKKFGKKLGFYNVGTGPVNTDRGKQMLRDLGNLVDFITVRDQDSMDLLRDVGVTNPNMLMTADAAISVKPASPERVDQILQSLGLFGEKEILAINVNSYLNTWAGGTQQTLTTDSFSTIYADALNRVIQKLNVPLMFVCTQHHDIEITKKIMAKVKGAPKMALFTNESYGHHDIKGVLGRMSLLFAMRLHANILASSALTPTAALAFQKKVRSYYDRLGLSSYVMSFDDFTAEKIEEHILRAWNDRRSIRQALEAQIPQLMIEADKAAEVVASIHRGEDIAAKIDQLKSKAAPMRVVNSN